VEVLVATLLVAAAAAGVADLVVIAIRSIQDARDETAAALLAVQKIEELRGAEWPSVAAALSPADALDQETPGFADVVDASGQVVGAGVPRSALYVRRWSVGPLPGDPARGRVLRVYVTPARREAARVAGAASSRAHAEVLFATARTLR